MWSLLNLLQTLAVVLCLGFLLVFSAPVCRHTSLTLARGWLIAAGMAVALMVASDFDARLWPDRLADYGWYLTSILLLCPPMAVLGARRPGVRVWTWFILVPMIAVLSWPVWTVLLQGSEWRGLALETPTVLGFGLVLIMGVGNYLGTRYWPSAVLYFMGTFMLFSSCTGWNWVPDADWCRRWGVWLLIAAAFPGRRSAEKAHPANRVWNDFRNSFGMVWGLRMVERINALAVQEGWTIRLNYAGFPENEAGKLSSNETEVTAASRWLFRRFVDQAWIDERLGPETDASQSRF